MYKYWLLNNLSGTFICEQRATFVVMNLIKALQQDNETVVSASCAYLVNRHPTLIEAHANDDVDKVKIELVEEKTN